MTAMSYALEVERAGRLGLRQEMGLKPRGTDRQDGEMTMIQTLSKRQAGRA